MFDTVIRGAQIVDGNGAAPFSGDIAIQDGLIQAVARLQGAAGKKFKPMARSQPQVGLMCILIMMGR